MDILRIKCPSCGVVLEVKNSKNEAIKKIKCPNCQKQLAITFADFPSSTPSNTRKPMKSIYQGGSGIQLKEGSNSIPGIPSHETIINVLALANGDWKYVLQVLTSEATIKVNNQPLQKGDEVNLALGDEVQVGQESFSFGKPSRIETPVQSSNVIDVPDTEKQPSKSSSSIPWLPIVVFVGFLVFSVWYFWPSKPNPQPKAVETDTIVTVKDHAKATTPKAKVEDKKAPAPKPEKIEKEQPVQSDSETSAYNLETKAAKGDVNAQYKLGMQWVTSNDCSTVIKGVRYLEAAAGRGHADALYALGIIYHKGSPSCGILINPSLSRQYMQKAAENGSAKARRFLELNKD